MSCFTDDGWRELDGKEILIGIVSFTRDGTKCKKGGRVYENVVSNKVWVAQAMLKCKQLENQNNNERSVHMKMQNN